MLPWWQTQSTTWSTLAPRQIKALLTRLKNTSPRYWRKGRISRRWTSSEMNCTTTANLCPYSSYRQLAPQQDYISSEQFTPQTRWYPSCPPHMIAWIQHSMALRRLTTSLHQRWTPTQYLKSLLPTATVWNVGHKGVHALGTLNPAAHSADVKVAWLQNAKMSSVKHKHS